MPLVLPTIRCQADCPEDVASYIHRVGRTARYVSSGKGLLLLLPSEREGMLAQVTGWEGRHEWCKEWRALLQGCAPE